MAGLLEAADLQLRRSTQLFDEIAASPLIPSSASSTAAGPAPAYMCSTTQATLAQTVAALNARLARLETVVYSLEGRLEAALLAPGGTAQHPLSPSSPYGPLIKAALQPVFDAIARHDQLLGDVVHVVSSVAAATSAAAVTEARGRKRTPSPAAGRDAIRGAVEQEVARAQQHTAAAVRHGTLREAAAMVERATTLAGLPRPIDDPVLSQEPPSAATTPDRPPTATPTQRSAERTGQRETSLGTETFRSTVAEEPDPASVLFSLGSPPRDELPPPAAHTPPPRPMDVSAVDTAVSATSSAATSPQISLLRLSPGQSPAATPIRANSRDSLPSPQRRSGGSSLSTAAALRMLHPGSTGTPPSSLPGRGSSLGTASSDLPRGAGHTPSSGGDTPSLLRVVQDIVRGDFVPTPSMLEDTATLTTTSDATRGRLFASP